MKWLPLPLIMLPMMALLAIGACALPAKSTSSPDSPAHRANIRLTISQDTIYYEVRGETTKEIFSSLEANGPDYEAEASGGFTSGLTRTESSFEYEFLDKGAYCELQSADINLRLVVTLPMHSTPQALSDLQLSRWQGFADGVAVHEQNHVDIYINRIKAFKKRLEDSPQRFSDCDSLKSSVASAWELEKTLAEQEQDAFHLAEAQLSQSLRKPMQMQIDQNKSELDKLQRKLDSLSLEIDELNLKIGDIGRSAQPYEAQMDAIKGQYPDLVLPSDTFDEYERLLAAWNTLNDLRNRLVGDVNGAIQLRNQTAEEFNKLTEQTNQAIDQLAWLP